jgi:hypothetical protein
MIPLPSSTVLAAIKTANQQARYFGAESTINGEITHSSAQQPNVFLATFVQAFVSE